MSKQNEKRWSDLGSPLVTVLVRIASAGLGFAVVLLVTTELGADQSGLLYGSLAWTFALAMIANWGGSHILLIDCSMLRDRFRRPMIAALTNRITMTGTLRALMLAGLASAAFYVANVVEHTAPIMVWILIPATVLTVVLQLLASVGKATGSQDRSVFLEFSAIPLVVLVSLPAIGFFGAKVTANAVGVAYLVGTIVAITVLYVFVLRRFWHFRLTKRLSVSQKSRSANLALADLATFVSTQGGMLILPLMLSLEEVGVFNVILRIGLTIGLFASVVNWLIVPKLTAAIDKNCQAEWLDAIRHSRKLMLILAVIYVCAATVGGKAILWFMGEQFSDEYWALLVMSILLAIGMSLGPSSAILAVARQDRILRNVAFFSGVAALIFLLVLTHGFGVFGASVATGATYLLQKLVLRYLERRAIGSEKWRVLDGEPTLR